MAVHVGSFSGPCLVLFSLKSECVIVMEHLFLFIHSDHCGSFWKDFLTGGSFDLFAVARCLRSRKMVGGLFPL